MGLEIGPAPERSRSWTSWTSYISYEARWPRVSTHARNVLKCGPNDVSGAWNVAYVITGSHQRNAMSWARPGSAGGALGRPWGPWGGGVMQSVCSRKPPYKIHEDLRHNSGKGRADENSSKNYPLQSSNRRAACGTLSEIDPRPFLEISAKM